MNGVLNTLSTELENEHRIHTAQTCLHCKKEYILPKIQPRHVCCHEPQHVGIH